MASVDSLLLSGFADEAANQKTIDQQFSVFSALGLRYLSLRFIDCGNGVKNVMQLDDAEIQLIKGKLSEYGLSVSSIGSPIGKVKLLDVDDGTHNAFRPFDRYLQEDVQRACELAVKFGSKLIRGFSFYHPLGREPKDYIPEVVLRLKEIAKACESHGLTFGLEVESNLVGQNGGLLAEIHQAVDHPALLLIFDGGNLVTQGYSEDEVFEQYRLMKPGLGWIHIKDFLNPAGVPKTKHVDEESLKHFVPADIGQSGHVRILKDLKNLLPELNAKLASRGIDGVFADLEPHVKGGGQFGGFSGPDGFGVALRAFCSVCDDAAIKYQLRDFGDIRQDRGF